MVVMVKYAILCVILVAVIAGAYYSGYKAGSGDTRVEYVTKEIEVTKYVNKKKADIYSKPNAGRTALLQLLHNGIL